MDDVGSEIGQKMRSAIKAKLTELGCYVDDELPDYVMVMVANKRTRAQMEDDLQLFLGDNTELFVNWLHQVLKKLQEVTVTAPAKTTDTDKSKERSTSKERKSKDKKDKDKGKKGDSIKKSKKKEKEKDKLSRKKVEKKIHKSKKKSKHHGMIRPNIPPLLMNIEKESEPSITDVFAGQILKNHGITLDSLKDEPKIVEKKPVIQELKRPIIPIIDPATIPHIDPDSQTVETDSNSQEATTEPSTTEPREEQIKEITEIEAKIQGLKQKLAEQLDSMSDDEDFLNIRTEAEELMNDFADDVFQEISEQAPISTPPLNTRKSVSPIPPPIPIEIPKPTSKDPIETLPQIELKLPKRPVRERLGAREEKKAPEKPRDTDKWTDSPERFTPEREPEFRPQTKSAKSRLGDIPEPKKRDSLSDDPDKSESKRLTSKVSVLDNRSSRSRCASIVRVRPRPRVGVNASSLLLRAVADAHKSLLNIPPKVDIEPAKVKRALVLPMRRCVEAQKIVIQVPGADIQDNNSDNISLGGDMDSEDDKSSKVTSEGDKEEYVPASITKKIINNEYVPSRRTEVRTATRRDDTLVIESLNIHNPTVDKDKNTQFIVTMDGYHPNAFLAKKLMTEGILEENIQDKLNETQSALKAAAKRHDSDEIDKEKRQEENNSENREKETKESDKNEDNTSCNQKKRVSNTSEESDTQVIIKKEEAKEKRKSLDELKVQEESPPAKRRKRSPIVFDVPKKDKEVEKVRERTESVSSDNQVVVTTPNTHKYDALPPLLVAERKIVWCRSFPLCRYGSSCAFQHPRCKFLAACTRRGCVYSHAPHAPVAPPSPVPPVVASHVVPAANYKTISPGTLPSICKFYPNCTNSACHFYHPKPCRYGKACLNKLECNFYHADITTKYRYPL